MFFSMRVVSALVVSLSLLNPTLANPQPTTLTRDPTLPTTCPRSTTTTSSSTTIVFPACPTVTVTIGHILPACPVFTGICNCPLEPTPSTITYGCVGKCCPKTTPTVSRLPTFSCPTNCAGVCTTPAPTTVTKGC